jgi:hypothetical protein
VIERRSTCMHTSVSHTSVCNYPARSSRVHAPPGLQTHQRPRGSDCRHLRRAALNHPGNASTPRSPSCSRSVTDARATLAGGRRRIRDP